MKFLLKLLAIAALVLFGLINYRYYSFEKGMSVMSLNGKETVGAAVSMITSPATKVEYYKKTVKRNGYDYKVYIVTSSHAYLLDATEKDIRTLGVYGLVSTKLTPQLIKPIPFFIEIVLGIIVLAAPFGSKKK